MKEPDENLLEFYDLIKDEFPDLSLEQVRSICYSPFSLIRNVFDAGTLESFKVKHLGKFIILRPRLKKIKYSINETNYGIVLSDEKKKRLLEKIKEYESIHGEL